jgi:hypothetical protein
MPDWEYVTTPLLLHQEARILNNWGEQGWELVTVQPGAQGGLIAFLKRPLVSTTVSEED